MVVEGPTWASAVCRAGVAPDSPLYQNTVLALVPATSDVEVAGGPLTRSGGFELKKSLAAATAEAAGSAVCARLVIALVNAVCRLPAVALALAPMVNWFAPGGEAVVACRVMVWLEPSGKVRPKAMVSPALGLAPRLTASDGGALDVTVAPVKFEVMLATLKPNGEVAESSASDTLEPAPPTTRRPVPVPTSACRRSLVTWTRPAWAPLPLRISSLLATDGVVVALPEKM